jgi:hypothetical protein
MDIKQVLQLLVNDALKKLYEKDRDLIIHEPEDINIDEWQKHVGERAISFRFGYYLQRLIDDCPDYQFLNNYNIDSEYNRSGFSIKALPSFQKGIYPDLIIHKRVFIDDLSEYLAAIDNVLVIELKSWWNSDTSIDRVKIEELTKKNGRYRYKAGVSVLLFREEAKITWFKQGKFENTYSLPLAIL